MSAETDMPKTALFSELGVGYEMDYTWILCGLLVIALLLVFACVSGLICKRHSKKKQNAEPMPCSKCGETNHPSAAKCSGCGAETTPLYEPEVKRVSKR